MGDDNPRRRTYSAAMAEGAPHIVLKLDTKSPIELGDFVNAFTSLSAQYQRFIREEHSDLTPDAQIYVREIRAGCIEADLIPWLSSVGVPAVISIMDQILIVDSFVKRYGTRLGAYLSGNKVEGATRSDLRDLMGQVAAIANDPDGNSSISSVSFDETTGQKKTRASIKFDTNQAKMATRAIEEQKRTMERDTNADYVRQLMVFYQSNVKNTDIGRRTGERVVIEDIAPNDMPLIYASELAEERIKHEIRDAAENVYKKGFIVDVNVQTRNGKPVGYRVTNVHQIIDLPD